MASEFSQTPPFQEDGKQRGVVNIARLSADENKNATPSFISYHLFKNHEKDDSEICMQLTKMFDKLTGNGNGNKMNMRVHVLEGILSSIETDGSSAR
ncbi:hypothetical protein ANCDUO_24051, partial [Ancylostoma duodenale]